MSSELMQLTQMRSDLYSFLSSAFLEELDEDDLNRFAERAEEDGLEFVPSEVLEQDEDPESFAGAELLRSFGNELSELDESERAEFVEDLAAEYAALFLMTGPKQVNPYESFYLGDEPMLYQEPAIKVKNIMEELDFQRGLDHPEPEDHVGNELAFMGFLCCSAHNEFEVGQLEYARRYLNLQKEFLEKHLLEWVPQFCDDVVERTESDFYEALARMTKDFLQQEPEMIANMMEMVEEAEA